MVHCQHLNKMFPQKIIHHLHTLFRDGDGKGKKKPISSMYLISFLKRSIIPPYSASSLVLPSLH